MSRKITIIGAGNVGATIAYTLSLGDTAPEIVLIDIAKDKADGEVMDIIQGASFRDPISVIAGDYADAKGSDAVIITSGIARKPGQSRLELTQTNVNIIKDIAPKIAAVAPNALYIIVSNPVDIMTYAFAKISGIPENQIIGSGTLLDTARLRYGLCEHYDVAQKNIHAYVFGEHGDSSFVPWSLANISGVEPDEFARNLKEMGREVAPLDRDALENYVHTSGSEIIKRKKATFYAISVAVTKLLNVLFSANESLMTVSSMMHGEYGLEDVCLSVLTMVGPEGICGRVETKLTDEELKKLHASAKVLKDIIAQIEL